MSNSSNLTMMNTSFEKVQIRPSEDWGVVTIVSTDDMECPQTGCEPIELNNVSVKFLNYGFNLSTDLSLSSFLFINAEKITLSISDSSFGYNIVQNGAVLYLTRLK